MRGLWAISALGVLMACGDGGSPAGEGPDAGAAADAGPTVDLTEPMFDPDRVLNIDIQMASEDWDTLRNQSRSILDVLGSSCLQSPPERPFTYFRATVVIDGERVSDVGVRKKGFFGSLSTTKPSLKIKFSEFVPEQFFSGMKRMTLNNAISDPSYVKQCIGYDLFRKAGVPAPRCNYAVVSVNGTKIGLYTHIESIKKRFLARHFDDNDGNMYEGALSDFRPGWVETFQRKTNDEDPDRSDIEALVPALDKPDGELLAALEPLIDIDAFIDFWAMELIVMHADGYARNTNNFYMYRDPDDGKFYFIPWGIDAIMFGDVTLPWEDQRPPPAIWAEGKLARRLYNLPETRAQYFTRVQQLLDTVFVEADIKAEIDRMESLITPHVPTNESAAFSSALTAVRDFVDTRRSILSTAMSQPDPSWGTTLRDPWCAEQIGTISGSFDTTWDNLDAQDPWAEGSGTAMGTVEGSTLAPIQVSAVSGPDPESENQPVIRVLVQTSATVVLLAQFVVPGGLPASGTVEVDWLEASGYLLEIDFATMPPAFRVVGMLGDGTLTITEANTTSGGRIRGSFSATTVYEPLF